MELQIFINKYGIKGDEVTKMAKYFSNKTFSEEKWIKIYNENFNKKLVKKEVVKKTVKTTKNKK